MRLSEYQARAMEDAIDRQRMTPKEANEFVQRLIRDFPPDPPKARWIAGTVTALTFIFAMMVLLRALVIFFPYTWMLFAWIGIS